MPLAGRALLALWNDIARAREPEYDRWHTHEHVPERVAVPGFRGARRYVNRGREAHRYFTLYELDDLAVLDSPAYRALIAQPTPWSASMRADFANFLRVPCTVEASLGDGIGGALAALCFMHPGTTPASLRALLELPGVVGCHEAQGRASPLAWASTDTSAATRAFDRVLLIEALERDHAQRALHAARAALALATQPADFGNDVYDLAFAFPGHDAGAAARHARAAPR